MARTVGAAQALFGVRVGEAEDVWYDTRRWPAFVDELERVEAVDGDWPRVGGRVIWASRAGGRGRVVQRVTAYAVRSSQTVQVDDPALTGTQRVSFAPRDDGCEIALQLDYTLKTRGFGGPLTDVLFVRRLLRDSMRRTLRRFAVELTAERGPAG